MQQGLETTRESLRLSSASRRQLQMHVQDRGVLASTLHATPRTFFHGKIGIAFALARFFHHALAGVHDGERHYRSREQGPPEERSAECALPADAA